MKILIVTHYFLPHKGGIEFVAYNQAKELVNKGHDVIIISCKVGDEPSKELLDGIKIKRVKAWNIFEDKFGIPYPIISPGLLKILNSEVKSSDIVHVHDCFYLAPFFATLIAKIKRKPVVLMQHVEVVKTKYKTVNFVQKIVHLTYGRYIINSSDKNIVCNKLVKKWLKKPSKTIFLENAVDLKLFKPTTKEKKIKLRKKYHLPLDLPIIIHVGRFVGKKNQTKLFKAEDKTYFILFVGEGEVPFKINKDDNVMVLSSCPQKELVELYQLSDIFCLPSINEGFPLTILDAMASGLPIITTNHEGYELYLDKTKTSLIKPEVSEIKKAIKEIIFNKERLKEMGKYSRSESLKRFSWEKNTNKLLEIYKGVLANANIKK